MNVTSHTYYEKHFLQHEHFDKTIPPFFLMFFYDYGTLQTIRG